MRPQSSLLFISQGPPKIVPAESGNFWQDQTRSNHLKQSKFSESQIVSILKEAETDPQYNTRICHSENADWGKQSRDENQ